jgi:integrase
MAKIITRVWSSRGPTGKRTRHVSYGYDVRIGGQRERTVSAEWTTEAQALDALSRRLKDAEHGKVSQPADASLGALVENYLQYKAERGKRSLREDRRILTKRLLPAFGAERPARQLTEQLIAQYEKRRGGQVSTFTVANELTVLRHMLRLGRRWGYLEQVPEIEMPKKPEPRERYLDQAEIDRLIPACCASRNPYLAAIVLLALNTGMRKAEILGLEWPRVDLATSRLTLYRTKSGKPRGIPINRAVYDALVAIEPDQGRRAGLVFARRDGAAWGQIRTAFAAALKRAAIAGFRFHDLRHTFASHYMMRGGQLYDLKEILGHSDVKMTTRYAHLSPAHLRAGVDALDGLTAASETLRESSETVPGGHIDGHKVLESGPAQDTAPHKSAKSQRAPVAQVDRAAVS